MSAASTDFRDRSCFICGSRGSREGLKYLDVRISFACPMACKRCYPRAAELVAGAKAEAEKRRDWEDK